MAYTKTFLLPKLKTHLLKYYIQYQYQNVLKSHQSFILRDSFLIWNLIGLTFILPRKTTVNNYLRFFKYKYLTATGPKPRTT